MIENLSKAVFLIFANKQDVEGAMTEEEIFASLNLSEIKNHTWHIQKCSALKGQGITEGLDWLHSQLTKQN